jgi:hypothetical protein
MSEMTPGQAAYEAWRGDDVASALVPPWAGVGDGDRARWQTGAQAVLKAGTCPHGDLTAERDELRELLDDIGVTAANAPEDGDSFGLLEQIAMRIAAADVPIEEWPDSARDALDAQTLHDSPGEDL